MSREIEEVINPPTVMLAITVYPLTNDVVLKTTMVDPTKERMIKFLRGIADFMEHPDANRVYLGEQRL